MQVAKNAQSFPTRIRARVHLEQCVNLDEVRWVIIAQEDGRFSAAVLGAENAQLRHVGIVVLA